MSAVDKDILVSNEDDSVSYDSGHSSGSEDESFEPSVHLTIQWRNSNVSLDFAPDATVSVLFEMIESVLDIPQEHTKILVPKGPLLKVPFKDPDYLLKNLEGKTLKLMGSSKSDVGAVNDMCDKLRKIKEARQSQRSRARAPQRRPTVSPEDAKYTFLQVRPLSGLPHPERSEKLLLRLKEDPGIKAVMKKHKFTVSLLTEMEPLSNTQTTHEGTSRLLGLNRNMGEVIELRLRTDAHDGYRDYLTIRKTLCHELTHNVHGDHDAKFWNLCRQLEREAAAADWKRNGRTIEETSRYHRLNEDVESVQMDDEDHGGWTGGEFVLGGVKENSQGMSRREVLAQAALERQRREDKAERTAAEAAEKGWRPCQRPQQNNNQGEGSRD